MPVERDADRDHHGGEGQREDACQLRQRLRPNAKVAHQHIGRDGGDGADRVGKDVAEAENENGQRDGGGSGHRALRLICCVCSLPRKRGRERAGRKQKAKALNS
jgi:hypothetical protein